MPTTTAPAGAVAPLTPEQLRSFDELGYIVLERFLDDDLTAQLKAELDAHVADGSKRPPYQLPQHGLLITHPPLMTLLEQVLKPGFVMHHLHTARHDAGCPGVAWHQDYEQEPQTNRAHAMVHVFYYLNGLDGTIGDLLVWPGSHKLPLPRGPWNDLIGNHDLPGSRTFDSLPPGSAVIVHSALMHGRRQKPGGEGKPRYFIDISYCERGPRWPLNRGYIDLVRRAQEAGCDRGGRYAHVFDTTQYFAIEDAWAAFGPLNVGSLAERALDGRLT